MTNTARRRLRFGISEYLFSTFGVTIVFLLAILVNTTVTSFNRVRQSTLAELNSAAAVQAQSLSASLGPIVSGLQATASGQAIASLNSAQCTTALVNLYQSLSGTGSLAVISPDMQVICASQNDLLAPGVWNSATRWIAEATASGSSLIEPGVADVHTGKTSVLVVAPVHGVDGSHAFFVATLPFSLFFTQPKTSLSPDEVYVVLSKDGSTIFARYPGGIGYSGRAVGRAAIGHALPAGATSVLDVDGRQRIYREATVASTGWRVLIGITPAEAFASANSDLRRNLLLAGAMVATLVGLWLLLYRRLARPVRNLRAVIEAAGRDGSVRAPLEGPTEIAAVAEAFNATLAERQEFERQLSYQALHDPLTNLANRTLLADRIQLSLARQRRGGQLIAVALLDLDRFKLVNDAHGHPAGDQLLVALSRRLAAVLRPDDTLARFGGDEFLVLSEGLADESEVIAIAARIVDALKEPFTLKAGQIYLSGSIGVAIARGGEKPEDLIRNADVAMYEAKASGNPTAIYNEHMHAGVLSRLDTERDLHRALAVGELVLHYQPKWSLNTGEIVGVEALVRWAHPTRGLLLPAEFISIAEETGLIGPLGEWVLAEACAQTVRWREEHGVTMATAVNLSGSQLGSPDLPATVTEILRSSGANASDVWLEVTEGSLLGDPSAAVERLAAIRQLGVRISIDDFGTGYSSLAYLRMLPIDEIKIDRSFITDIAHDALAGAIVSSVVQLGHALGLVVIAEGVESAAQLDELHRFGCDLAQGFHLGRPQTADQLIQLLQSGRRRPRLATTLAGTPE